VVAGLNVESAPGRHSQKKVSHCVHLGRSDKAADAQGKRDCFAIGANFNAAAARLVRLAFVHFVPLQNRRITLKLKPLSVGKGRLAVAL